MDKSYNARKIDDDAYPERLLPEIIKIFISGTMPCDSIQNPFSSDSQNTNTHTHISQRYICWANEWCETQTTETSTRLIRKVPTEKLSLSLCNFHVGTRSSFFSAKQMLSLVSYDLNPISIESNKSIHSTIRWMALPTINKI